MSDEKPKRAGIYAAVAFCWVDRKAGGMTARSEIGVAYGPDEKNAQNIAIGELIRDNPPHKPDKDGDTPRGHQLWYSTRIDDELVRQAHRALEAVGGLSVPAAEGGELSVVPKAKETKS